MDLYSLNEWKPGTSVETPFFEEPSGVTSDFIFL